MLSELPSWAQDTADAWPMIVGVVALLSWIGKRWKTWVGEHIADPLDRLARLTEYHLGPNGGSPRMLDRVEGLSERVRTLEIVHHTDGVRLHEAAEAIREYKEKYGDG